MIEAAAVATVERAEDTAKDDGGLVRLWLDALAIASNEEDNWRKTAEKTVALYRQSSSDPSDKVQDRKKFNILHSNIETMLPALYNSTPVPDIRRRFNDADPIAKTVADLQERCITYSIESYDFDHVMGFAVSDMELAGRASTRVRYLPYVGQDEQLAYQEVKCEHVQWKHFRRGPGKTWDDVPWIAFELFLTRDQLTSLSPELGSKVSLDCEIAGHEQKGEGRNTPEIFKRARVWEIWDKDNRKVLFIATGYKEGPIRQEDDPLGLQEFFPIPRPLYAVATSDSLVPVVPYELYKSQAEELERVTERIQVLTGALKARSIHDARITELGSLEDKEDAESVPIENVAIFADGSKLADHIMFWPIEVIAATLEKLYLAREQIKQTIYEITGIADILRGQTDPNETLGAQEIKQQWGSLRIQKKQQEIQRYARDIFRMKAEIFASKFEPQVLEMMTGIKLSPQPDDQPDAIQQKQQVIQLLKSDALRGFRVDVESDSTIRADLSRNQQNMNMFLQGTGAFAQSMGPIVMQFPAVAPVVMEVFTAFARNFKLGKQAEDALDSVAQMAQQAAQQPKPPDPAVEAEKAKAEAVQQKAQVDLQLAQQKAAIDTQSKQQEHDMKMQMMQAELQQKEKELEFKDRELQMKEREMAMTAQFKERELAVNTAGMERKAQLDASSAEHKHELGMEVMDAKAKQAKQKPAARA